MFQYFPPFLLHIIAQSKKCGKENMRHFQFPKGLLSSPSNVSPFLMNYTLQGEVFQQIFETDKPSEDFP